MKRVVILGVGQGREAVSHLLNHNNLKIVAIGDNDSRKWNDEGEIPILSVSKALLYEPDLVLIAVLGQERDCQLRGQLCDLGYKGEVMSLDDIYRCFDLRGGVMRRIAQRIAKHNASGAMAELGVYRGDFAWQMNELFPGRKLYLFDTFAGFSHQDVETEERMGGSHVTVNDFADAREEDVLARMPHREQVVVMKGRFPETAVGLEERFALVSMDVDLFAPTLAGLEYFFPRLHSGGAILLHDYNSRQFAGVKKAVEAYEEKHGVLPLIPLGDLHGTAAIIRA